MENELPSALEEIFQLGEQVQDSGEAVQVSSDLLIRGLSEALDMLAEALSEVGTYYLLSRQILTELLPQDSETKGE